MEETPAVDPARPAPPHKRAGGGLKDMIIQLKPPRGGSTAAQRFWRKEGCAKERSLEEQSFEV